jgi:hypothetical protein
LRREDFKVKPFLALLATVLLGVITTACGSAEKGTTSSSQGSSPTTATDSSTASSPQDYTKVDADKDNDVSAAPDDTKNNSVLDFGQPASVSDTQAVAAVVKRYYAAAKAGDGTTACSLLYSTFAEAIAEDEGKGSPGASYLSSGTTCPQVLTLLFKHYQAQLAVEVPMLKVARVRLDQRHGLAILSFGKLPERQISVAREGRTWKIENLLDSELP